MESRTLEFKQSDAEDLMNLIQSPARDRTALNCSQQDVGLYTQSGWFSSGVADFQSSKRAIMSKKKSNGMVQVQARISPNRYEYLTDLLAKSPGSTLSEILRDILENKPVKLRYQNVALEEFMHQLSEIYSEIHRIGVNLNQVTKEYHQSNQPIQKFLIGKKLIEYLRLVQQAIE
ncbi:hypothetical protein [Algoriphagus aquimarinus]|uniref:plasmid mobilization protein n=1 Tax=Algoriphagus aquimarinus TaxID=237018 RepID=UPI0030DC35C2|tara:strand:- start:119606 stop:120130 length:525 start_codon:yes stop_codon:yes gene_type:complete